MEPWGTPHVTCLMSDFLPLYKTNRDLLVK